MSGSVIGGRLDEAFRRADSEPNTYSHDLDAVSEHLEAIREVFEPIRHNVYVERALVQLTNNSDYPVGHIIFDAETDAYRFIPHVDSHADTDTEKES